MLERTFKVVFEDNNIRSREELTDIFGVPDRAVRNLIRKARRSGIPIMAMPEGGYKLAATEEEKRKLLHMYRGRALDELATYSALSKAMQMEGQLGLEDILREGQTGG